MRLEDWDVFLRYSRRVRSLHHHYEPSTYHPIGVALDVFQVLSIPPTSLLVPNLQHLHWHDYRVPIAFVRLLTGPKLASLTLRTNTGHALYIIPALSVSCPLLRHIDLGCLFYSAAYARVLDDALPKWTQLESLACGEITPDAYCHLAQLPSLKSLSFRTPSGLTATGSPQGSSAYAFATLESLEIYSNTFSPSALFFPSTSSPLRRFSIKLVADNSQPNPIAISQIFNSLASRCTPDTHLRILLDLSRIDLPTSRVESALTLDNFSPLLSCRNLRAFSIKSGYLFVLDDHDLGQMARAWPHLEILELGTSHGWEGLSQITLQGLTPLLRHCPLLRTLGLSLNATTVGPRRARPGKGICNTHLKELTLGDSRISKPAYVAAFLSAVLPCVTSIKAWDDGVIYNSKYKRRWVQVTNLLGAFANAREQERRGLELGDYGEGEMDGGNLGSDSEPYASESSASSGSLSG
ncbi:hypothetical protein BV22DRAFT_93819 [Leucogyrophana mollusca]|uniref:Uncharacterized protein n=1 Tax=Leucogyrophana mollusca TaxID=85980 RepID=A0ACB8BXS7_9AGAM|nr:hypothetical protein BV22DRAFT_93819 [Leucogyrophana mollusca]